MQINDALETYTGDDEEHKSFAFMHCWYRLKDEDKWKSWRLELSTKQKPAAKKQKSTKDSTPSAGDEKINDEVVEVADAGSAERKRPPGQK